MYKSESESEVAPVASVCDFMTVNTQVPLFPRERDRQKGGGGCHFSISNPGSKPGSTGRL